ncbi:MAG: FAD-dependent oxidoreductase [Phycisphaerales bacterium]|nr:FAD-dependent oxidoreductase [Phycisphaerales bacterium]
MAVSLFARWWQRRNASQRLSRRDFLAGAGAVSATVLLGRLPGCTVPPRGPAAQPGSADRRIIIIGAGFAGLAAAYELRQAGCEVVVLEARRRVGGRVLSFGDLVPGKTAEGGAELIGANHPQWLDYADRFGLDFLAVEEDELEFSVTLNGRRLTAAEVDAVFEELETVLGRLTDLARPIDADRPWLSTDAARLDQQSVAEWLAAQRDISPLCRRAFEVQLEADNTVPLVRQSLLGLLACIRGGGLEKYWTESEAFRCRGGNQQLAHRLRAALGEEHLRLECPVAAVRSDDRGVVVEAASGECLTADAVVVAVPPSVWDRIRFEPALPAQLRPQMGVAVKYLAAVARPFWSAAGLSPWSFGDGPVSWTWEGTAGQSRPAGPAVLVSFSGGAAAEACRRFPTDTRDVRYAQELERVYPGFTAERQTARFMDWPSDPWTRAGYSFPAPGQVTLQGPILHAGLGPVHFAGEHVCYKFIGYMEGALQSGVAVARRVLSAPATARVAMATR